jgi:hypothetical protein
LGRGNFHFLDLLLSELGDNIAFANLGTPTYEIVFKVHTIKYYMDEILTF